ncbi:dihydroneopterin aldolase [Agriterribacter sp.]|uniref:dihydroneopterin aldolase n=1 Tax=Agriterribacter sp. TaxID=2821509 RepID=UPI002BB1CC27|nr:dihydroneopterin aldolase [Agriterribacter sp.]HRP55859.1 dihydroneopterin aldolase [Agriterribacter sp.]
MLKISLHNLKFHGFHGLYKEERSTGNDFEVTMDVYFNETVEMITRLQDTVNYAVLYQLVKDRMAIPEPLLETIAMDIAQQVKKQFPLVYEINVSVSKINPPLLNFQGETSVTYNKQYPG